MEVHYMRKQCEQILKNLFHETLVNTRYQVELTQEQMAAILMMDVRSYVELDHGNSGCSALTLCLFLVFVCEKPGEFLDKFKVYAERRRSNVA